MNPSLQSALDIITENSSGPDDLIAAKCRGLLRGYHARWWEPTQEYRVLSVEHQLEGPLYNPATGATSRTFRLAGKIDVRAELRQRNIVWDHKTTSDDISDPNSSYWRSLIIEAQPTHYMLLEWLNGHKTDEAMWDVVRKPTISPRKLESKSEIQSTIKTREYYGHNLSDSEVISVQQTGRESFPMYESRLAWDCTENRPEYYFQRRAVVRLDSQIQEKAGELWDWSQEIITARRTGRWGKNEKACLAYKTPCKFLGICSGFDSPDSDKWTRKQQVHSELVNVEGDGRRLLTNSCLGTFKTCRQRYFFEYELGLERIDEEEREVLYFGNLWHRGQEKWWSTFIPTTEQEQYVQCTNDSAGTHLATVTGSNEYHSKIQCI